MEFPTTFLTGQRWATWPAICYLPPLLRPPLIPLLVQLPIAFTHTHTHTLRSCCKANLFKLKVNTLSSTHAHTYTRLMSYLKRCMGHAHLLWQHHKVYNSIGNKPQRVIGILPLPTPPPLHSLHAPSLRSPRSVLARLLFVYALPYSRLPPPPLWKIMLQPLCPTY